jgi:hypothetical protein
VVFPRAAQGVLSGGDPLAGVRMGCLSQRLRGLLLSVSTASLRTIPEQVSFE